jgi:acetyl-CoA carboxylase biotin carboxyl carrier protein
MKFQHIKELIELVDGKEITSVNIEKEGFKISIKKETEKMIALNTQPSVHIEKGIEKPREVEHKEAKVTNEKKIEDVEDAIIVKSPIVGTFYSAPSPEVSDYVKLGDQISKGDTLCIIEAMKLMNEIEAEVSGEVVEIMVKNEDIVEYGQPLFKIK